MTDIDFFAFLDALRDAVRRAGVSPEVVEVDETGRRVALPLAGGTRFVIERDHLDVVGGTPEQIAAAVYAVYRQDALVIPTISAP